MRFRSFLFLCGVMVWGIGAYVGPGYAFAAAEGQPSGVIGASPGRILRQRSASAAQTQPTTIVCTIPAGSTVCSTLIRWNSENVSSTLLTVQDVVGGPEALVAARSSGSQAVTIQGYPHRYTFRLYDASAGRPVLLAVVTLAAVGSGTISASPNPCTITGSSASCTSIITWSTLNVNAAKITVQDTVGGGETPFAAGRSGSQSVSILAPPHQYTFRLYDISSPDPIFLDATTVFANGTGTISGTPNPCPIPSGATTCTATISWSTNTLTSAKVTVQDGDSGQETNLFTGLSGSQPYTIQAPPHKYIFRLYDTSSGGAVWVASTVVLAVGSGTVSSSPNPCPIAKDATSCPTTISWNTQKIITAQVTWEDVGVGGTETDFATGLTGSQSFSVQPYPHQYVFRLYDASSGSRLWIASTGAVASGWGAVSAAPNPCLLAQSATACTSNISWNTQNAAAAEVTKEDTAVPPEALFASGRSGNKDASIQPRPHEYLFRLYDTSGGFRFWLDATTVTGVGPGMITASPNPCLLSGTSTSCTSTITWSAQNAAAAEITVEDAAGGGETNFTSGLSGSQDALIQPAPHRYTFRLYDISSGGRILLASTVVFAAGPGTISASPNPCAILSGSTTCTATITWDAKNATTAKVAVQDAGGAETDFATGLSGNKSAQIQAPPHEYTFRLYDTSSGGLVWLASTVVRATPPPPPPPTAPSNLTAQAGSTGSGKTLTAFVDLSWTDNSNNEDYFVMERCQGASCTNFISIATIPANTTKYRDTTVARRKTYRYRVKAANAAGFSPYSNIASATTP